MKHLDVRAAGLALGSFSALLMFMTALSAHIFGYGTVFVEIVSTVYVGYAPTLGGAIVGLVWGGVDGFIAGVVIAWLYNKYTR